MSGLEWSRRRRRLSAGLVLIGVVAVAVLGPLVAPYAAGEVVGRPFTRPGAGHVLGTDAIGRDVLTRLLHGGRTLVLLTVLSLLVSYAIGITLGLASGLSRRVDPWVMRPLDGLLVLPWFLLLAVVATAVGKGTWAIVLTSTLASVPWIGKILRDASRDASTAGYVEAARLRHEPGWRIAFVEVLPNLSRLVVADAGVRVTTTVSLIAVGSFLGLGLRPPTPDWSLMIAENRSGLALQPWAVLAPAILIVLLIGSVNLLADAVESPVTTAALRASAPPRSGAGGPALRVSQLSVRDAAGRVVLQPVDLQLARGGGLAIVGHSGAGKTSLAHALLGFHPAGFSVTGSVEVGSPADGRLVGYVPQDPGTSLNPALRIATHLEEIGRAHGRRVDIGRALAEVGLPSDRAFARRFPHQLSGGQQQRVLVAMAILLGPALVVLDEPTTGLDDATCAELVDLLVRVRSSGTALVVVTHDLERVATLVDEVLVLDQGEPRGPLPLPACAGQELRERPAAVGRADGRPPLLAVDGLRAGYGAGDVLAGVSLDLFAGECVALVGRSGEGKSTLGRCLVGLHRASAGVMTLDGRPLSPLLAGREAGQRTALQLVFQNPRRSLNPRRTVAQELRRAVRRGAGLTGAAAEEDVRRLMAAVHLPESLLARRPHQLSGGEQQRVAIARALATRPRVLVCDEISSSLDPPVRDVVLDVLAEVCERTGLAVLLITHDREAARRLAVRELTLDHGRLTEVEVVPAQSGM